MKQIQFFIIIFLILLKANLILLVLVLPYKNIFIAVEVVELVEFTGSPVCISVQCDST